MDGVMTRGFHLMLVSGVLPRVRAKPARPAPAPPPAPAASTPPSARCAPPGERGGPGSPPRRWHPQTLQAATGAERLITDVTITDRRHSLYGQRLEVAPEPSCRGPEWMSVILPDGRYRHVRRAATDLVSVAAGHVGPDRRDARISVRTLLPLADCLRVLLRASREEGADDQPRSCAPDQPPIPPATGCSGDTPDAVDGVTVGRPAQDRRGLCRHAGPEARASSSRSPGDPPC